MLVHACVLLLISLANLTVKVRVQVDDQSKKEK